MVDKIILKLIKIFIIFIFIYIFYINTFGLSDSSSLLIKKYDTTIKLYYEYIWNITNVSTQGITNICVFSVL